MNIRVEKKICGIILIFHIFGLFIQIWTKFKFLKLIKDNKIEFEVEDENFDEKILSYIINKVTYLQTEGKIDFFSPKTYEDLINNGLSTKEHKNTMKYYKSFINDVNYISNRWFLAVAKCVFSI